MSVLRAIRGLIAVLFLLALLVSVGLLTTASERPDASVLAMLAVVAGVAAVIPVRFVHAGQTQGFTLESGAVVALFLSGYAWVAPALMMGMSLLVHSVRSRDPVKTAFNTSRSGVETGMAALAFMLVGPSSPSPTDGSSIVAVLVAVTAFEVTSLVLTTELMARLGRTARRRTLQVVRGLWGVNVLGNLGYGIVLATVVQAELWVGGLASIMMLVMYLGYRGYAAAVSGERRARSLQQMTHRLIDLPTTDNLGDVLQELVSVFEGDSGALLVTHGDTTVEWQLKEGVSARRSLSAPPRSGLLASAMAQERGIVVAHPDRREHASVAAPIRRQGEPVGAVVISGRRGVEPWNDADASLLAAVANELAVALDNVALLDQVEEERVRLKAETEKLNDILGAASDGIASILADGTIEAWNPGMARITGVEAEAAVGQPWHAVLRLKDASGTDLAPTGNHVMRRALRGELRDEAISLQALRTDGAWRWLQCTASPVRHPDGEQRGLVLVARDVTADRELEDLKADFIATVSHELRTPLTPLKGFLATLRNPQTQLTHDQVHTIHTSMGSQLTRLETLIADLLAVAELDHGKFDLHPEPMAIGEVVADAVRVEAADQFLRCGLEVDQDVVAVADSVALVRVVRSLTSNAIKHTDGRITVQVVEAGAAVEVRIRDEGPGIAPWDQDRVFNRFERLGDHLRRTQGPGLGLTIARTLAQRMGGDIRVDSELGQGSTFILSLPRAALRSVPLQAVSDG